MFVGPHEWLKTTVFLVSSPQQRDFIAKPARRRPRTKNVPTQPQYAEVSIRILAGSASPTEIPNRVSEGKNAVGFNTPGAASSAAD